MQFSTIRGVISDMDGVLWRGDEPLPGLVSFFEKLRLRGIPFALATNNAGRSPADYVQKLAAFGLSGVDEAQIITSGTAAATYLQAHYPPGTPVHVLGGSGLHHVIKAAGFTLTDEGAAAVIIGLDRDLDYAKLTRAALLLRAGAAFVATNTDATYPAPEGLVPGAGSLVAALRVATDREPTVICGKPHAPMFEAALQVLGTAPEDTLMIGDRLNTDIEGAARLGFKTALVLTGVSTQEEAAQALIPPDGIYADLASLGAAWA